MKYEKIVLAEKNPEISLTTYFLDDSKEKLNGTPRPLVLVCPGGGYTMLSDREAEPIALRFAAMGFHAAVLRYTINAMDEDEKNIRPAYPLAMLDIAKALTKVQELATENQIDMKKIILCGFSAGGHNVTMYATQWNKKIKELYPETVIAPAAVIAGYPVTDYHIQNGHQFKNPFEKQVSEVSNLSLVGSKKLPENMLDEISPAKNVDAKTPPMFIWTTNEDSLVPSTHSLELALSLRRHEVPVEFHLFESGKHGLALATQATASAQSEIKEDIAGWINLAETWLLKRFGLTLPEKTFYEDFI